jgi:hypothetical protein
MDILSNEFFQKIQGALLDGIDAAQEYNQEGDVHKASIVTDFCWALLDYGSAVLEGAAMGAIGTVVSVFTDPIGTGISILAGQWILAYQLTKVAINVADIGLAYCIDSTDGKQKWSDYTKPLNETLDALKKGKISNRDVVKGSVAFGVGVLARSKLIGSLTRMYTTIATKVTEFIKNNPLAMLQEYMATPDGSLLKVMQTPPPEKLIASTQRSAHMNEIDPMYPKGSSGILGAFSNRAHTLKEAIDATARIIANKINHIVPPCGKHAWERLVPGFVKYAKEQPEEVWEEIRKIIHKVMLEGNEEISKQGNLMRSLFIKNEKAQVCYRYRDNHVLDIVNAWIDTRSKSL